MIYTCPECGGTVSDQARKCPNCGCPIKFVVNPDGTKDFTIPKITIKDIWREMLCPFKCYWRMIDKYKDSGRTKRKEYWEAYLLNIVAWPVIFMICSLLIVFLQDNIDFSNENSHTINLVIRMVLLAVPFFLIYALFKAAVRRLHDANRSGWEMGWLLVPVIGWIWLAFLHCLPSYKEDNEYGLYSNNN